VRDAMDVGGDSVRLDFAWLDNAVLSARVVAYCRARGRGMQRGAMAT
jgi:hypothetical protein